MASSQRAGGARAERSTAPALRGGAIAVMLGLVALASGRGAWANAPQPSAIAWPAALITALAIVALSTGLVLVLVLLRWIVAARRRGDPADPPLVPLRIRLGVRDAIVLMAIAAVLVGGVGVAVVELTRHDTRAQPARPIGRPQTTESAPVPRAPAPGSGVAPAVLLVIGSALVAGLSGLATYALRQPALAPSGGGRRWAGDMSAPEVAEDWPADARLAAFAAYRRAERVLGGAGLPRDAAEGPREYLARVARRPGAGGAELRELTATYEKARFSPHAVGAKERTAALSALRRLEADLEAAHGGDR